MSNRQSIIINFSFLKVKTNALALILTLALSVDTAIGQVQIRVPYDFSNLDVNGDYKNLHVTAIYSDSLVSSFVIWIKKEVKPHKHLSHSEQVYVIEGEAQMIIGDKEFNIKPGSFVFIPRNTVHSVSTTSAIPLKVLSIQAPKFDGKDRVFVEE